MVLAANGAGALDILLRKDIMVADTGVSCYVFTFSDWMTKVKSSDESSGIRVDGQCIIERHGIGDLPVTFKDKDGPVAQV
jgi:hypothetical protein